MAVDAVISEGGIAAVSGASIYSMMLTQAPFEGVGGANFMLNRATGDRLAAFSVLNVQRGVLSGQPQPQAQATMKLETIATFDPRKSYMSFEQLNNTTPIFSGGTTTRPTDGSVVDVNTGAGERGGAGDDGSTALHIVIALLCLGQWHSERLLRVSGLLGLPAPSHPRAHAGRVCVAAIGTSNN